VKSFRGTIIFAVIVAAVAGYTYWDYKNSQKAEERKAEAEKLVPIQESEIASIRLTHKGETLELKKDGSKWKVTAPVEDLGDAGAIRAYIDTIAAEKGQVIKSEGVQWKDYFLDPPGATLILKKADGGEIKVEIGSNASFDGQHFLRMGDSVYIGSAVWARIMEKPVGQVRDKTIFRVDTEPTAIEIRNQSKDLKEKVKLNRQGALWKVDGLVDELVDPVKVRKFVDDLRQLRADDFAPESKSDRKTLTKYKIQPADRSVKVHYEVDGKPGVFTMDIGAAVDGSHYAVTSDSEAVFKLGTAAADKFQVTSATFRQTHPLTFAKNEVSQIHVDVNKTQLRLKKIETGGWSIDGQQEGKEVQPGKVDDLLDKMTKLATKDFPKSAKGLDSPKGRIRLSRADGAPILELAWGEEYVIPYGPLKGENLYFARSSLAKDIVGISSFDIKELPVLELVKSVPVSEKK